MMPGEASYTLTCTFSLLVPEGDTIIQTRFTATSCSTLSLHCANHFPRSVFSALSYGFSSSTASKITSCSRFLASTWIHNANQLATTAITTLPCIPTCGATPSFLFAITRALTLHQTLGIDLALSTIIALSSFGLFKADILYLTPVASVTWHGSQPPRATTQTVRFQTSRGTSVLASLAIRSSCTLHKLRRSLKHARIEILRLLPAKFARTPALQIASLFAKIIDKTITRFILQAESFTLNAVGCRNTPVLRFGTPLRKVHILVGHKFGAIFKESFPGTRFGEIQLNGPKEFFFLSSARRGIMDRYL